MIEHDCCQIGVTYKATGNRDTATLEIAAIQHRDAPFDIERVMLALRENSSYCRRMAIMVRR